MCQGREILGIGTVLVVNKRLLLLDASKCSAHDMSMSLTERNMPVSMIGRISIILDCFTHSEATLSISELARRSGLAKSTTSRLVAELAQHGFLEQQPTGITLGLRFFELGEKAVRPRSLRRLTYSHMEGLRRTTGHTVHLAVLDGRHVVYIEILPSRTTPALPSRVGGRVPAHATAVGKALLAFSDPSVTERLVTSGLETVGPQTITDPDQLRAALWRIRSTGIAVEHEESGAEVACVGAPILVNGDHPLAAISVSGWANSIDLQACAVAIRKVTEVLRIQAESLPVHRQKI